MSLLRRQWSIGERYYTVKTKNRHIRALWHFIFIYFLHTALCLDMTTLVWTLDAYQYYKNHTIPLSHSLSVRKNQRIRRMKHLQSKSDYNYPMNDYDRTMLWFQHQYIYTYIYVVHQYQDKYIPKEVEQKQKKAHTNWI